MNTSVRAYSLSKGIIPVKTITGNAASASTANTICTVPLAFGLGKKALPMASRPPIMTAVPIIMLIPMPVSLPSPSPSYSEAAIQGRKTLISRIAPPTSAAIFVRGFRKPSSEGAILARDGSSGAPVFGTFTFGSLASLTGAAFLAVVGNSGQLLLV